MFEKTKLLWEVQELREKAREAAQALDKLNGIVQVLNRSVRLANKAVQGHREKNACPTRLDETLYRTFGLLAETTSAELDEITRAKE
jgi:hypothetical protein